MTRNSFSMKVYAANGTTVLESFSTETEGMPVDLFVSLIANPSGSAMFDDVTASGPGAVLIPEPAALLSLPALSMLLRRRRLALR